MFPSKGYFRNAMCPFFQHGLCHRPYCHFKHSKEERQSRSQSKKEKVNDVKTETLTPVFDEHKDGEAHDEVMKIVKNISPSKLLAYAQRKQEERELQKTLAELDEQNKKKQSGLIDTFYNKSVNLVNHDPKIKSLEDITQTLMQIPSRKVCECDDPDCSGFIDYHPNVGLSDNSHNESDNLAVRNEDKRTPVNNKKLSDVAFFAAQSMSNKKRKRKLKGPEQNESSVIKKKNLSETKQLFTDQIEPKKQDEGLNFIEDDVLQSVVKKTRIAHAKAEVVKSTVLSMKSSMKATKLVSTTTLPVDADKYTAETGIYLGKKRLAHSSVAPIISTESFARPKLKVEYGGKIAHNLRQLYLDKIIDELIPKCQSEAQACEKGFAEEASAYQRSNRKQIYLNLCANIIKRVRSLPVYTPPETEKQEISNSGTSNMETNRLKVTSVTGYQKFEHTTPTVFPKKIIKPVSAALVLAASASKIIDYKQRRSSSEPVELNEDTFYTYLQEYLLSEGQLWENKYPIMDPKNKKMAMIKDYAPIPQTSLKRQCCRCGKDYFMNAKGKYITKEECNFHWGKLRKIKEKGAFSTQFSCCQSSESGEPCSFSRLHVCDKMTPLDEFVSTHNCSNMDAKRKILALDCEMCYTTQGLELTRLTIVDYHLQPMIDLYVKPSNPIVDYNTRFSGVTKEHLQNATMTLEDIHDILLGVLHRDTILLGHSLESDLFALKMIHQNIVDTAIVFPHRLGHPFKRALRNLMADHLKKIIQNGESGHDSCEDASACMELMKYKFKEDNKKKNHSISFPSSSFYKTKSLDH